MNIPVPNGYKRLMAEIAVFTFIIGSLSGLFVDRLFVERREAAFESRLMAVEQREAERKERQAETMARIESRLRSIEVGQMEMAVQVAELNIRLGGSERSKKR